jgi:hypothetical protein
MTTPNNNAKMGQYLHCFDLSDQLKCFNFCSRRVVESLFSIQLITGDNKSNPRSLEIENLINCRPVDIDGLSSSRMAIVYQASINRTLKRPLTAAEQIVIKKADLEIEFERRRREINYGAPSRLSCLYLVDNDIDGRTILQNLFVGTFGRPLIVEVDILNKMELTKCDHHWLQKYYEEPMDEYIVNYWTGVPLNEKFPSWEYLLEGTIVLTHQEQANEIDRHVENEFPIYYEQIQLERQRQ